MRRNNLRLISLRFFVITSLLGVILSDDQIYNITFFRSNPMVMGESEGLFQVNLNIPEGSRVLSYIDFNNDKYVDMIVAYKNLDDSESLKFYKYVYELGMFQEEFFSRTKTYEPEYMIKNLVANDLNNDGYLDLIVTVYDTFSDTYITEVHLFDEKQNAYNEVFKKKVDGVFIGDFDGNKKVDLMYFDKLSGQRKIVNFIDNSSYKENLFSTYFLDDATVCDGNELYTKVPIPIDHSSAFVDIDVDCQNDLVIHSRDEKFDPVAKKTIYTKYLEIWRGVRINDEIKYCLKKSSIFKIEDNLGPFTVADFNRDGLLDVVFPVLGTSNILIAYNQINLKYNWYDDYCDTHKLNQTNFPVVFNKISTKEVNSTELVVVDLTDGPDEVFYQDKNFPPLIRVGDINSDSFPDLITVKRNFKTDKTTTRVYLNIKKYPDDIDSSIRTYSCNNTYTLPVNNSIYASFFDLDENGQLDLIIVSKENSAYKIHGFYNNYIYDAFFLKSGTLLKKDVFYSNEIGVNYRYISTNLNGSRRMDVNFQMIQLGTNYLNMPYAYIGIGRSNNYIENFHVISNSFAKGQTNYKYFTPIIPNSGLIISKEIDNLSNPQTISWELDLIVKPTSQLFTLIITIVIILVVILAIIIYLHLKELQEDQEVENKNFFAWYS